MRLDSGYASRANLKQVRACGGPWLTRLKRNRRVNSDEQSLRPLQHCALRAFLRLESPRLRTGRSWYEAIKQLLRDAIRTLLANPTYILHPATA